MVGTDSVAKAAPDGQTLLLMETSAVLHSYLHTNVPYDVTTDFAPIARVALSPLLLFAQPDLRRQQRPRADHARPRGARPALGRHARHRHAASSRPAHAQRARQGRYRQRALPRRRAGRERCAGGPDPDGLGRADGGDAACRSRQVEALGRRFGATRAVIAAGADDRRERRAGLRSRHLVRARGAGQDAARSGGAAVQGDRRHRRRARFQDAHREGRPHPGLPRRSRVRRGNSRPTTSASATSSRPPASSRTDGARTNRRSVRYGNDTGRLP